MPAVIRTSYDLALTFRRHVDDISDDWEHNDTPLLWSNDEVLQFLNDAVNEYHRRRQRRVDTVPVPAPPATTVAMTHVPALAGQRLFDLDPRIYSVRSVQWDTACLVKLQVDWLPCPLPDQLAPTCFYFESPQLKLDSPVPTDGELVLNVNRFELAALPRIGRNAATDALDCRPEDTYALVHWMAFRAYSKADADTLDIERADRERQLFDEFIGPRVSSQLERQRQQELQGSRMITRCYY